MVGDVDENMISRVDAQMLASQAQYFHTEPQGMNLFFFTVHSYHLFCRTK